MILFLMISPTFCIYAESLELESKGNNTVTKRNTAYIPTFIKQAKKLSFKNWTISNDNGIFRSTNNGRNWTRVKIKYDFKKFDVKKQNGTIIRTEDDGKTWTVVEQNNQSLLDISIHPNPSPHFFKISFHNKLQNGYQIKIVNSYGILVFEENCMESTDKNLNLGFLPKGVYIVSIYAKDKIFRPCKIIIKD